MIEINGYLYFYDSEGHLNCVNDAYTGATVYIPNHADYTPDNDLTASFLATQPDLTDRPPLPTPEVTILDWAGFINALPGEILIAIAQSLLAALITARMAVLQTTPSDWKGEGDRLITAWNAAPPSLNELQRETLIHLATHHSLPLLIEENNQLSL